MVCVVCAGVMVKPTIGCSGLHSFCRGCYVLALEKKKECPTCRDPVDEQKLKLNRDLEGLILQLPCKHSKEGGRAAKRAKPTPANSMTDEALKEELGQRGQPIGGRKAALIARLEEDRVSDAGEGCEWAGKVGELGAHLQGCEWTPLQCPYRGCMESPLRKDALEHEATCGSCEVQCGHEGCEKKWERRSLAEHEGRCPRAEIECPNEGCRETERRGWMIEHRAECAHEEIHCPGSSGSHAYKCDARFLRKDINAHIRAVHLWEDQPAEDLVRRLWEENASQKAASKSELRHAAHALPPTHPPPPTDPRVTLRVFNWRAFWAPGEYLSKTVDDVGAGWDGKLNLNP